MRGVGGARRTSASTPASTPASLRSISPLPSLGETLRVLPALAVCAMCGVLTRVGLNELFGTAVLDDTSATTETFQNWFPNAWGSFVMGLLVPMRQSSFFKRHAWLYVGLTTGYCGCTTTFSSWSQDAAAGVVSSANVVVYLLVLFEGIAAPFICFVAGRHVQAFLALLWITLRNQVTRRRRRRRRETEEEKQQQQEEEEEEEEEEDDDDDEGEEVMERVNEGDDDRRTAQGLRQIPPVITGEIGEREVETSMEREKVEETVDHDHKKREEKKQRGGSSSWWHWAWVDLAYCVCFSIVLGLLCVAWFILIVFGGVSNRYIWLSCLFAPFGAFIRYVLGRYNAWSKCVRFPFFTFLVNVVGSIGLAFTAISIELRDYNANSDLAGYVLKAFEVGFFGSLTTISTFVGELYALPPVPYAYIYIFASVGIAQTALILINGLYTWL